METKAVVQSRVPVPTLFSVPTQHSGPEPTDGSSARIGRVSSQQGGGERVQAARLYLRCSQIAPTATLPTRWWQLPQEGSRTELCSYVWTDCSGRGASLGRDPLRCQGGPHRKRVNRERSPRGRPWTQWPRGVQCTDPESDPSPARQGSWSVELHA